MIRSPAFDLVERGQRLAVVADAAVGVVLENGKIVLGGDLDEPLAALDADRATGGVLEGRDRVEERDLASSAELGLESVEIEALLVHGQRHDLRPVARQDLQGPVVGRPLDEHTTRPRGELHGRVEHEPLQPAGRQKHPARLDAVPFREQLPQRTVAAARPVRQDRDPVALERRRRAVGDQLLVEAFRRGCSARERDRCHPMSLAGRPSRLDENRPPRRTRQLLLPLSTGIRRCAAPGDQLLSTLGSDDPSRWFEGRWSRITIKESKTECQNQPLPRLG